MLVRAAVQFCKGHEFVPTLPFYNGSCGIKEDDWMLFYDMYLTAVAEKFSPALS